MAKVDFTIIRGDSESIIVDLKENNTPLDITGMTIFFTVKPALTDDLTDSTAIITKNVTSLTDPTSGIATIDLTPSDTNKTPGIYYYDVQFKDADGVITSIPYGTLEIIHDVGRRTT